MGLKIVIIEDEPTIARHLRRILKELDKDITVLETLSSVSDSIKWLDQNMESCDLIFTDIRLSDGLSFEIYKQIKPSIPLIFITAYEEYALEAFQANGIHYVVKPFEKNDIQKAVEKYGMLTTSSQNLFNEEKLMDLVGRLGSYNEANYKKAYLVHYQNKLIPIAVDSIAWFHTEQDIVYARTFENKTYIIDTTLERVFSEISPNNFFRANRQFIVNRNAIKDIDFYFHGRLILNVAPSAEEKIIVSKAKVPSLKNWMGNN